MIWFNGHMLQVCIVGCLICLPDRVMRVVLAGTDVLSGMDASMPYRCADIVPDHRQYAGRQLWSYQAPDLKAALEEGEVGLHGGHDRFQKAVALASVNFCQLPREIKACLL